MAAGDLALLEREVDNFAMTLFPLARAFLSLAAGDSHSLTAPELLRDLSGAPIDLSEGWGHAGPLVLDLDGAAPLDLLAGDLRGSLHVYLGRNTEQGVRYEAKGPLSRATPKGSEPIRVHNW